MNPNQPLGNSGPGGTVTPPNPPQPANTGSINDIPEDGFGFADEQPQLPQVVRPTTPVQPQPIAPRPAPQLSAPPRPVIPPPAQMPAPAAPTPVTPVAAPAPIPQAPVPTPPLPTQATPVAVPEPTAPPATVMPPQQVPAVPTLTTTVPAPQPAQPAATPVSAPRPTAYAAPAPPEPQEPFDPAKVPVSAWSTPVNPITATYSPEPNVTHLPEDIANRINEKPMQNSGDILRQIKHGLDGSRIKSILSFIVFVTAIFAAAFLINQYIFQSYYVEGTSMTPTLQNDDRLIISKVERTMAGIQGKPYIPERGQIVVLDSSIVGLNGQHEQLIKRVVGLPGDRIHIEAGTVIITNTEHPDGYDVTKALGLTNLQPAYTDEPIDLTVPEGRVYVMGDNREQGGSYDSRSFGPIEGNQIQGRLWGRVLPLDKAQLY